MLVHLAVCAMRRRKMCALVLSAFLVTAVLLAPRANLAETPESDATITVSSSTATAPLGLTLVEGVLRHHNKSYLLTLRGAEPAAGSTGKVYALTRPRDIEGRYTPSEKGLRNERGVTIVFDPPLQVPGGELQIDLNIRVYPKASTGQRGTVD